MRPSRGGGQVQAEGRVVRASDVAVPKGYRVEALASGLSFPSAVTFDDAGRVYVLEAGYSYGEVFGTPTLLRLLPDGHSEVIAAGNNGPWTGVVFHGGAFYVAEGGEISGGRILRIDRTGAITPLVRDLPSLGDHHTNGLAIGNDGYLYFGQGTATNSGVVGEDDAEFGWLGRHPAFHDVPCQDITLTGANFETRNVLSAPAKDRATTGAFLPFGTPSQENQIIRGVVPCNGAVLRIPLAGGRPELVAWGFRNPFGIAFSPDGALYVTDNGYDDRGSRPVFGAADMLWRVQPGLWYGWPDFSEGRPLFDNPLTSDRYRPPGKAVPKRLLATHPNPPPKPAAYLAVHASADGFDFSRNTAFGYLGEAFIAEFGDQAPLAGKTLHPVGFKVVRVDVSRGVSADFAANRAPGPASKLENGGLERPVAARFDASGRALYIVDFGIMTMDAHGAHPIPKSGVLWRVTRSGEGT